MFLLLKLFIETECDSNRGPGWPSVSTYPHVQGTPTIQGPKNKTRTNDLILKWARELNRYSPKTVYK